MTRPANHSRFANLRGNLAALLDWLSVVWTIAAFGEEMVFRGHLMNRITDLVGKTRKGWIVALPSSSLIFGLAHHYQGLAGIIGTGVVGLLLGILYDQQTKPLDQHPVPRGIRQHFPDHSVL